ncbi:hypothetical protein TrRE_jg11382 [Triparma retinervis]|uniref:DM2 domain-containing protein n=1 Tax=Triparma retinervis TaxID=2557542 RepID=A0A9W6ZLX5_9STRA|nr:hypothetical protein TrRE_jg11382 [Triparma retinervis]
MSLQDIVLGLLAGVNTDELKFKEFFLKVAAEYEGDLTDRKAEVKQMVIDAITAANEEDSDEEEEEESEDEAPKKKGGGYNKEMKLSPPFAEFLGVPTCSRPQIVKMMWVYIKDKGLQDPKDKRKILLDEAMQAVFKRKTFTMFSMNKFISEHLMQDGEVNDGGGVKKENPDDKRQIICDAKFKAVMGGNETVTMFSMNKHITPHLLGPAGVKKEE